MLSFVFEPYHVHDRDTVSYAALKPRWLNHFIPTLCQRKTVYGQLPAPRSLCRATYGYSFGGKGMLGRVKRLGIVTSVP